MPKKTDTNTALRTPETWQRYQERRKTKDPAECFLCHPQSRSDSELVVKEFTHFFIVANEYPYDAVAEVHHLLAPKRHIDDQDDLDVDELHEYGETVVPYLEENYDFIGQNTPHNQTVPQHLHLHLLTWRRV